MRWSDPFLHVWSRIALKIHRRFFNTRHFWVTGHRAGLVEWSVWCLECGTAKYHSYPCRTEHRLRQSCELAGGYPRCDEILGALRYVRSPDANTYRLCDWCMEQVRRGNSAVLYIEDEQ